MTTSNPLRGCPVGTVGYGRFTAEERVLFVAGKLDEKIMAAKKTVKPVESMEDMYARLFAAE